MPKEIPTLEQEKELKKKQEQKESVLLAETYVKITEKAQKLRKEINEIEKAKKEKSRVGVSGEKIGERELQIKHEMQVLGGVENILRFRKENKNYRVALYQIPDGWNSPDKLTKVKFRQEGIEGLSVYYDKMGQFNEDTLKFPNPLMTRDIISYLYEDRRLALPIETQKNILSKLKPGEKKRWATDYENIKIIFERTKTISAPGKMYPEEEIARMAVEVTQEY